MANCPNCGAPLEGNGEKCNCCGWQNVSTTTNSGNTNVTTSNSKANLFLSMNSKKFPEDKLIFIKDKLNKANDETLQNLSMLELKDPTTVTVISVFFGELGIDRFMLGDVGPGIGKLLTAGGFGLWWFIDLFLVGKKAKEKNFATLMSIL